MAVELSLEIATTSTPAEVAQALAAVTGDLGLLPESVPPSQFLGDGIRTMSGVYLIVGQDEQQPWQTIPEVLGFRPTVFVLFRFDKFEDIPLQQDEAVGLTVGVLDRIPGDAILHCDLETAWLVRKGEDLVLDDSDEVWTQQRLAALAPPYRRATIDLDA